MEKTVRNNEGSKDTKKGLITGNRTFNENHKEKYT